MMGLKGAFHRPEGKTKLRFVGMENAPLLIFLIILNICVFIFSVDI